MTDHRFDVLGTIGKTPLVELKSLSRASGCQTFAKLKFLNPMGSIKDRVAHYMIEAAERDGRIQPGDLILENSSGNTAMGIALVAIQKGYRLKVVVRDRISREELDQLRSLGVEIQLVDSSLPPEHPDSYNRITPRLAKQTPKCYFPDQHSNRENNAAHYHGIGSEIWEQMEGRIDAFVAEAGTGGTIGGVGRYMKERDSRIQVIATMDFEILDDILQVPDQIAFLEVRALSKSEGLLVGGSSGAAIWGVRQVAAKLGPQARVVTVLPDGASRYLSTVFNDDWMRAQGLLPPNCDQVGVV